jgi:hypothetical protein
MATIKVDFYRVDISSTGNVSFESLIDQVLKKSTKDRVIEIRAAPIWLNEASIDQDFVEGDLVRLRMTDLPVKGNLSGIIENLQLNDNEGIGGQTAFLYHLPTKVLLLQASKSGVSPPNLVRYLREINQFEGSLCIDPVLNSDILIKLDELQEFRQLEIRVAGLEHLPTDQDDYAIRDIIRMSHEFRSPSLSLTLSVGKARNKSLLPELVKQLANNLIKRYNQHPQQVKRLRVSGNSEDENFALDLLKDRMREEIASNGTSRTHSYQQRNGILKKAWQHREKELLEMFS